MTYSYWIKHPRYEWREITIVYKFDMKDLEEISVILGVKITRSEKGISFDQFCYVEENILKKYDYFHCKCACTPYVPSIKLFKNIS